MSAATLGRRFGNKLYRAAFPIYRPIYSAFKAHADRIERQLLAANLANGAVAVDAGANIGIYSRFLSKCVGPSGFVHSFEPAAENFAHLSAVAEALPNVRAHQSAVGAKTGEQLLYISEDLNVDHRLYPAEGEKRQTISTEVIALDDYFKPGARVDLIKADIQGYELYALHGAQRVLTDNPSIKLLLEFWPHGLREAGSSARSLLSFLEGHAFEVYRVGSDLLQQHGYAETMDNDPTIYHNLFARRGGID